MAEPINVTIGGEAVAVPPVLNFAALERVWPSLKAMTETDDLTYRVSAAIGLISGALLETRPERTVPEIKKRLRINVVDGTDERAGMMEAVNYLLIASGLVRSGEAVPAEAPA